jgi:hypothetical protein
MNLRPEFLFIFFAFIVGSISYALKILAQIVHNQERVAGALETIARKLEGGGKP